MGVLVMLIIVGSTIWLGVDASGRDWSENKFANSTTKWVIGSLALWIVTFPTYMVHRRRAPLKRAAPPASPSALWPPAVSSVPTPQANASKDRSD